MIGWIAKTDFYLMQNYATLKKVYKVTFSVAQLCHRKSDFINLFKMMMKKKTTVSKKAAMSNQLTKNIAQQTIDPRVY
jgi:hypothetical protein